MKITLIILCMYGAFSLSTAALAGHHKEAKQPMHKKTKFMQQLDLTEEQRAQLQALRVKMKSERTIPHGHHAKYKVMALNPADADYQQQVDQLASEMAENTRLRIQRRAKKQAAIYTILTPEQQQKWQSLKKDFLKNAMPNK